MSAAAGKRFMVVTADVETVLNRLRDETESPRQDFVELARSLDAEILSFSDVRRGSWFTRLLQKGAGQAVALAWLAFRKGGSFYFVTAENTAIPLALLLKFKRNVTTLALIGHRLTAPQKSWLVRILRLSDQISVMFCYSRQQERFAQQHLGLPAEKVWRIAFQVDEKFFTPPEQPCPGLGVVSVGRELRDYPTLFLALEDTEISVTVVASSPWSKREDQTRQRSIPANVTLRKGLSSVELRELYRSAAVVVVPLMNVDWPAGVTSLLEAQACGRPVVISASEGILDSLDEGAAVTVPCNNADALREAVLRLINTPGEAEKIARAGRASALIERTLDQFVAQISKICREAEAKGGL
jgi:glycosyltransferase involved in cell wall biosynthesis